MTGAKATPVPSDDRRPLEWVGRAFVSADAGTGVRSITVTVWRYVSEDAAARSMADFGQRVRAPDPMSQASVEDVETFPLSSLPGSLTSWVEVTRSGTTETPFAGGFFQQGALCWSMVTLGDDRDAMFELITHVAHDVLSRGIPATPEVEHPFVGGLWDLLPQAEDLPGAFELREFFEMETWYNPEGTPYPPFEKQSSLLRG